LIRFALANQWARASRTYVALAGDVVVGFQILVVGEVSPEQAPERIRKGLARHLIPLMVLARLAVAVDHQGQGLGAALLKDAIGRTLAAANIAGICALAVHAKDERARGFYEHFGFRPSPSDPLHLFVFRQTLIGLPDQDGAGGIAAIERIEELAHEGGAPDIRAASLGDVARPAQSC